MKVYVRNSDLGSAQPTIVASYSSDANLSPDLHGDNMRVLDVPDNMVEGAGAGLPMRLNENWRTAGGPTLVNQEAMRRIEEVFPDYSQRNALAAVTNFMLQYGYDIAQWPADAQAERAKLETGWMFVRQVRERANAMVNDQTANVTDDNQWPTKIDKIEVSA